MARPTPNMFGRMAGAYGDAFRARPWATTAATGAAPGLALFSYNQMMNAFSPSRRKEKQEIMSDAITDSIRDTIFTEEAQDALNQQAKQLPGQVSSAFTEGVKGSVKKQMDETFKSIKQNPRPWATAGAVSLAVPVLAYLGYKGFGKYRQYREDSAREEKARESRNRKRRKALAQRRRENEIRRRKRREAAARRRRKRRRELANLRAAAPKFNVKLGAGGRPSFFPQYTGVGKMTLTGTLGALAAGSAATSLGMAAKRGIEKAEDISHLVNPDKELAEAAANRYSTMTAQKVRDAITPEYVGEAAGKATGTAATEVLKSPWLYGGIVATVGTPYLLAYLLGNKKKKRRRRRKSKKTAAEEGGGPNPFLTLGGTAAGFSLPFLSRRVRRHSNLTVPGALAGTLFTTSGLVDETDSSDAFLTDKFSRTGGYATPALLPLWRRNRKAVAPLAIGSSALLGYSSLADEKLPTKAQAEVVRQSIPRINEMQAFMAETDKGAFHEAGDKLVQRVTSKGDDLIERAGAHGKTLGSAAVESLAKTFKERPLYSGLVIGGGITAIGALTAVLAKRMWDNAQELRDEK